MKISPSNCRTSVAWVGILCAVCVQASGCSDPIMNSGIAHPGRQPENQAGTPRPESSQDPATADARDAAIEVDQTTGPLESARPREFSVEGPEGAQRISF